MAALSLLFIPQIAWESQRDLTHSVLATTAAAATLFLCLKLHQTRLRRLYLLLGIAFGLGMLSNYNYALLMAGLLIAVLCVKEFRPLVLTPRMLVTLAVGFALFLPHAVWAREHAPVLLSTAHKLRIHSDTSVFVSMLRAVNNLTAAWLSHVISIVLIISVLCWKQLVPFPRAVLARPHIRFLLLVLVSALVSALVAMFITGATAFKGRWLQPIYFCVPILLVALIQERLTRAAAQRIIGAALAVTLLVMVALPARVWFAEKFGRMQELNAPFAELVKQLRPDVDDADVIVADSLFVGGNLRLLLPEKTVMTPPFGEPAPANGTCLIIFNATLDSQPSAELKGAPVNLAPGANFPAVRYIEALFRAHPAKRMRLGVIIANGEQFRGEIKLHGERRLKKEKAL